MSGKLFLFLLLPAAALCAQSGIFFRTTCPLANGVVGTSYTGSVSAAGSLSIGYSLSSGALPAGLQISNSGGISGTPTATGTASFTILATDLNAPSVTASLPCSMTINPAAPPPLDVRAGCPSSYATVGVAYSQTISAIGATGPYTFALGAGPLPAGLTLSQSGLLSGTPTASGTFPYSILIADSSSPTRSATLSCSLTVSANTPPPPSAKPPAITTSCPLMAAVTGQIYATMFASTSGTTPYTYSLAAGALPPGLTFQANGAIAGRPSASGTYSFTVRVTDAASQSATKPCSLSVR